MGLRMGEVRLEKSNKEWKGSFEIEKENLGKIFKGIALKIEHVGSTSIEGISAKPIIDIAVAVKKLNDFEKVRDEFYNIKDYSIKEDSPSDEILVRKGDPEEITHFIHIMEYNSERYKNQILFRDYLRTHEAERVEYEELKIKLAKKYKNDRKKYTANKNDFIQKVLKRAREEEEKLCLNYTQNISQQATNHKQ